MVAAADVSWSDDAGDATALGGGDKITTAEELEAALTAQPELAPPAAPVVRAVDLVVGAAKTTPTETLLPAAAAAPSAPAAPGP